MAKILVRNIPDSDYEKILKKAKGLGLTTPAYIRQIIKDSVQNTRSIEQADPLKSARAQVVVLAEALGRTQNATPESIEKLTKILLKKYDQEVQ